MWSLGALELPCEPVLGLWLGQRAVLGSPGGGGSRIVIKAYRA